MINKIKTLTWPELPYKGLRFYDSNDSLLFAGRSDDIEKCLLFFDSLSTRILLVHGLMGCGKSSFLRAGLIPELERNRFDILKVKNNFIRSTEDPLKVIVGAIFDFVSNYSDSLNERMIKSDILSEKSKRRFINKMKMNVDYLINIIDTLNLIIINPLIILIDQAEEVFTLNKYNDEIQKVYFNFLTKFSAQNINKIKILVGLRTEYFGRFSNSLLRTRQSRSSIGTYYLRSLSESELIDTIKHPTSKEKKYNFIPSSAFDKYQFYFEDGVVEKLIIPSLKNPEIEGYILPIMQIICLRLFQNKRAQRKKKPWVITESDFKSLGDINSQLIDYLDGVLKKIIQKENTSKFENIFGIVRWKKFLSNFARVHYDGTITSKTYNYSDLEYIGKDFNFVDFKSVVKKLSNERNAIILESKSSTLNFEKKIFIEKRYTLSHDSLAYALKKWKDDYSDITEIINEKKSLMLEAAHYKMNDLFGTDCIEKKTMFSINDHIWDHQTIVFAKEQNLFSRLGIEIDLEEYKDFINRPSEYAKVQNLLSKKNPGEIIISYPRVILEDELKDSSIDLSIIDVYTGYGIISRKKNISKFDWKFYNRSFIEIVNGFKGCKIFAEDKGAFQFAKSIEDLAKAIFDKEINLDLKLHDPDNGSLFDFFIDGKADYIVVTAPSRALTTQAGFPVAIDSNDVEELLNNYSGLKNSLKRKIFSNIYIHNCWNINVPISEWENDEYKKVILRLASVALFVVEYIKIEKNEVKNFLVTQWKNNIFYQKYPLESSIIIDTFYRCYKFPDKRNYFDLYFDFESTYSYKNSIELESISKNKSKPYNSYNVFKELLNYENKYYKLINEFDDLIGNNSLESEIYTKVKILKSQARKHYQIYNFYDAFVMLNEAIEILEKINGKNKIE